MGTTYDPKPVDNATAWGDWLRNAVDGMDNRLLGLESGGGGGAGGDVTSAKLGKVFLDSYTGSDDARLDSALAATNTTYPATVAHGNRAHTYTVPNRAFRAGLRLSWPEGYNNPEQAGQTKMASRTTLNFSGSWFTMTGSANVFSCSFFYPSFTGGSNATFLGQGTATGALWCLAIHGLSSSGLRSVLGTYAARLIIDGVYFTGPWEVNNCYDTAIHVAGSDNPRMWSDGLLLDSNVAYNTAGAGTVTGHPHLWLDFMEKSKIGPIYMTTEGPWGGILVTGPAYNAGGSNLGGPVTFEGGFWEGRNKDQGCNGSVYRQNGGIVTLRDVWASYGMISASAQGHTPTDAGMMHVYGSGSALFDGCTYDRATGVAETVPFVYSATGSRVRVFEQNVGSKGGTWSGLPRVDDVSGTSVTADSTVTVI